LMKLAVVDPSLPQVEHLHNARQRLSDISFSITDNRQRELRPNKVLL
jgi:hypothetical protein